MKIFSFSIDRKPNTRYMDYIVKSKILSQNILATVVDTTMISRLKNKKFNEEY